jgi:hypothetical protein
MWLMGKLKNLSLSLSPVGLLVLLFSYVWLV